MVCSLSIGAGGVFLKWFVWEEQKSSLSFCSCTYDVYMINVSEALRVLCRFQDEYKHMTPYYQSRVRGRSALRKLQVSLKQTET